MRIVGSTLDDLLWKLTPRLLSKKNIVHTSRRDAREILGVLLELENPRARLSRTETRGKPFSGIGELLWYLSGSDSLDFIKYYIDKYEDESEDGFTVYGAYGPRLFNQRGHNQLRNVINLLTTNQGSRRAVIQLFDAQDIAIRHKEVPCTCTFQFIARRNRLHMITTMRSNDVYIGLPHDIFCFTMIQEIVARSIGLEIGFYKHFVGSMHLYEHHRQMAQQYIDEGVQPTVLMPPMPTGDPWPAILTLLDAERQIRCRLALNKNVDNLHSYWVDLALLLQIFAATGDKSKIEALTTQLAFKRYMPYADSRKEMKPRNIDLPQQFLLL